MKRPAPLPQDSCQIRLSREQIEHALPRVERGLTRYWGIQSRFVNCDVTTDPEFQRAFVGFYRVRRNASWRQCFFRILEDGRTTRLSIEDVLRRILRATDRVEAAHRVVFQPIDGGYRLQPIGGRGRANTLAKWRSYSREEIPPLFGLEFSEAHWNQGHVSLGGHQFLLVSLEKAGQQEQFQYADHFVSPIEFEWQSQNRATQGNTYGLRVKNHRERGEAVHLFVRRHRKLNGGSAPFVYCGGVDFASWTGEKPITVRWTLKEPVPQRLWAELKVPSRPAS